MKLITKLAVMVSTFGLVGCLGGGGGGNFSSGGTFFTHSELATDFVYRLNVDAGFNVDLVKTNTDQYDYIVVYDWTFDTYDAYYLGNYNPGDDIVSYLNIYDTNFFYDLDIIGSNHYEDFWTGVTFEKTQATSAKDLQKVAALKEGLQIKSSADFIQAEYGLSESRSLEVARLAVQVANAPKDSMTDKDYDNFAKEVLGNSITEYKNAIQKAVTSGDKSDLDGLIDNAADVNGITPEDVDRIVSDVFGQKAI